MKKFLTQLWEGEIATPSERWRIWVTLLIAVFSVGFVLTTIVDALFNVTIMLGPGLVDSGLTPLQWAIRQLQPLFDKGDTTSLVFLAFFLPLALFCLIQNALAVYRGFTLYPQTVGRAYPLREFWTFFLLNAAMVLVLVLMLLLCGVIAWLCFGDFFKGYDIVYEMTMFSNNIVDRVPTLVVLPYPLPLIVTLLLVDFFYYWFHRWGHTQRLWWLLWHRPHHMTTEMIIPCVQPVFAAAPLFLLIAIPYQIGLGVLAKLFGPETMVMEALAFGLIGTIIGIYSHISAYYDSFAKNKIAMAVGHFYGLGNYHYMHHSSLPGHEVINIGGTFFLFWDRVFGTYVKPPEQKPPVGLTGQPELYMNPLRLALSGMTQIGYELKHNKDWRTRLKIIFGGSEYFPPQTKDFAKKKRDL